MVSVTVFRAMNIVSTQPQPFTLSSSHCLKIVICSLIKLIDIVHCVDQAAECILCIESCKESERGRTTLILI